MNVVRIAEEIDRILDQYEQAENKDELDRRLKYLRSKIGGETEEDKVLKINSVHDPEYKHYKQIALDNGIPAGTYYKRAIGYEWDYKRAATEPINRIYPKEYIELRNKHRKIAEKNGIHKNTFIKRLEKGMPMDVAATMPTKPYKKKVRA